MPAPALAERVEQVTCDWLGSRDHDDIAVFAVRAVAVRRAGRGTCTRCPARADRRRPRVTAARQDREPTAPYPATCTASDDADEYGAIDVALGLLDAGSRPTGAARPGRARAGPGGRAVAAQRVERRAGARRDAHQRAGGGGGGRAAGPRPTRGRVVVACMDGEWHALPARLVAEVLRFDGWDVTFLGASVPAAAPGLLPAPHDPRAVALACALPMRLPHALRDDRGLPAHRRARPGRWAAGSAQTGGGRAELGVACAPTDARGRRRLLADDRACGGVPPAPAGPPGRRRVRRPGRGAGSS